MNRSWGCSDVVLKFDFSDSRTLSGVVSIEVPGPPHQTTPGMGWDFRGHTPRYRSNQSGFYPSLSMKEAGHLIISGGIGLALGGWRTGASLVAGLIHWRTHNPNEDNLWFQLDDIANPPEVAGPADSLTSAGKPLPLEQVAVPWTYYSTQVPLLEHRIGARRNFKRRV